MAITVAMTAMISVFHRTLMSSSTIAMKFLRPYDSGGKAIGSPVLSDSSTRKTSGRMTRKPKTTRTITLMIACQLRRALRSSAVSDVKTGSTTSADDTVPFLGEVRTILLEGVPVREEELHVLERDAAARRRDVLARR